jgi:hypothetical protein
LAFLQNFHFAFLTQLPDDTTHVVHAVSPAWRAEQPQLFSRQGASDFGGAYCLRIVSGTQQTIGVHKNDLALGGGEVHLGCTLSLRGIGYGTQTPQLRIGMFDEGSRADRQQGY